MDLIPVIDLHRGQVVRGMRGERQAYRPIVSALCRSSDPIIVGRMLCDHCASDRLYVADLDALQGGPPQLAVLQALLQALHGIELWVDAGFGGPAESAALRTALGPAATKQFAAVYGSESLRPDQPWDDALAEPGAMLSLDHKAGARLDPAGVWLHPAQWPARVIVMTLDQVGADAGPDLAALRSVRDQAPRAALIGAGGVRDAADLQRAADAGAAGWLVASALHDLRLPARPRG